MSRCYSEKGDSARRDVAVTGELTLSGRILPVGGIKEKMLAARRAGVKIVVLPLKNKVDLENLPEDVRKGLEVHLVDRIEEVVDLVLTNNTDLNTDLSEQEKPAPVRYGSPCTTKCNVNIPARKVSEKLTEQRVKGLDLRNIK